MTIRKKDKLLEGIKVLKKEKSELKKILKSNKTRTKQAQIPTPNKKDFHNQLSDFSLKLSYLHSTELFQFITTKLKSILNVKVVFISTYNDASSELILQDSSLSAKYKEKVARLLGDQENQRRAYINKKDYKKITNQIFEKKSSLQHLNFVNASDSVITSIGKIFGLDWTARLTLVHNKKLVGTIVIGGDKNQSVPEKKSVLAISEVVSKAIIRKDTEERISNNENSFLLGKSIGVGVITTDGLGLITNMNPVAERMCGWKLKEALGKPLDEVFNIIDAETNSKLSIPIEKVFKTGNVFKLANDTLLISKDGTKRNISDSASPIIDKENKIQGMVLVFFDDTESYTNRKKLIDSQEKLKVTAQLAKVGGWEIDLLGNTLFWTEETFRIHELEGNIPPAVSDAIKFYHEDDQQKVTLAVQQAIESGQNFDFEARLITKRNNQKYVRAIGHPEYKDGKVIGVHGMIQDITERKLDELELQIRNSSIMSSISGIALADMNGKINFANPAWLKMFGYNSINEVSMTTPLDHVKNPTDAIMVIDCVESKKHWRGEVVCKKSDGSFFPAELVSNIVTDSSGRAVCLFASFLDISERKKYETDLKNEKERISTILNLVGDPIFVKDNQHRFILGNKAFFEMVGLDENNVIEKTLAEDIPADEMEHFLKVDRMVLDSGIQNTTEEILTINNKTKTIVTSKTRFIDDSGNKFLIGSIHDITERKRAEEELLLSEQKFSKVFRSNPDSVTLTELASGLIIEVNDGFTEVFGYTREEVLGRTTIELGLYQNLSDRKKMVETIKQQGNVRNLELVGRRKNGSILFAQLSAEIISIGAKDFLVTITRDITDLKINEEIIRESEKKYRLLFESNPHPMWVYDLETLAFLSVNDAAVLKYGYTKEEFLRMTIKDIRPPEDISKLLAKVKLVPTGIDEAGVWRHCKKDGSLMFVEIISYALEFEGRKAELILSNDVTERKKVEEALNNSEERYRLISKVVSDYVFSSSIDHNGNLILNWVAGSFEEITGYNLTEYIDAGGWVAHLHPEDIDTDSSDMENLKANHDVVTEVRTIKRNGEIVWVRVYAHPIWDNAENRLTGIYGAVQNITEHKLAEEQIIKSNKILKEKVEELDALNTLSRYVNSNLLTKETIIAALNGIVNALHPDFAFFFLRDSEKLILQYILPEGSRDRLGIIPEHKVGECVCGIAVKEGKPIFSLNIFEDLRCTWEECKKAGIRSFAAIPLFNREEVIAVIGLASEVERDFEKQASFLETLASQISIAVTNSQLHEAVNLELIERQAAQNALSISEEKLKTTAQLAKVGGWEIDLLENNLYWSEETFQIHELEHRETPDVESAILFYHQDDQKRVSDSISIAIETGKSFDFEAKLITALNTQKFVRATGHAVYKNGKAVSLQGMIQDISERKIAQEMITKLSTSFAHLFGKSFFEAVCCDASKILGLDYVFVGQLNLNGNGVSVLGGWAKGKAMIPLTYELIDTPCDEVVGKQLCFYRSNVQNIFPKDELLKVDGIEGYIGIPLFSKENKAIGIMVGLHGSELTNIEFIQQVFSVYTDRVSAELQRYETESALKEREELYRNLVENLNEAVMLVDNDDRIQFVNNKFTELLGYTPDEIIGKIGYELLVPPEKQKVILHANSDRRAGKSSQYELDFVKKNGEYRTFIINGSPVYDADGNVTGSLGALTDITERKKVEEAFQKINRQFKLVWEKSTDGMRLTTETGVIVAVNDSYCKMVEKKEEELVGDYLSVIYKAELKEEIIYKYIQNFQAKTLIPIAERETELWNGKKIWFEISNSFLEFEGKSPLLLGVFRDITERKKAEEELIKREQKFEQLLQNSFDTIVLLDENGIQKYVSASAEKVHGYSALEVTDIPVIEQMIHPDDRENVLEAFKKIIETGEGGAQYRHKRKSGGWVYLEARGTNQLNNPDIQGVVVNVRDITKQKEAEKELKRYSKIYEDSLNEIFLFDIHNYKFKHANQAAQNNIGYSMDELLNMTPVDIKPEFSLDEFTKLIEQLISGKEEVIIFETVHERKNKTRYNVQIHLQLLQIEDEKLFAAIILDITNRKRSEEVQNILYNIALQIHLEKSTKELLEFIRQEVSNVVDTSNFFAAIYNHEKDTFKEIIYVDEMDSFESDEWSAGQSISGYVVKKGKAVFLKGDELDDFCRLHNLGLEGTIPKSWIGVPLISHAKPIGIMVIQNYKNVNAFSFSDVSMIEMIAHEVGVFIEKHSMIEELIKAKEKAEEMNKAKSHFFANMSHELRTPFVGIMGYAELLIDTIEDPQQKAMVDGIIKSSKRMQETLSKILSLAKLESTAVEAQNNKVNINELIANLFDSFEGGALIKELSFTKEINFDELVIETDEKIVKDMLQNFINNAIKFTNKGSVKITADKVNESGNEVLVIKIADTGIGIPKEKLDIIWEPFRQASEGINRSFEGTGLGLSIVKKSADLIGGKVSVQSELQKGSVFTLELPLQRYL